MVFSKKKEKNKIRKWKSLKTLLSLEQEKTGKVPLLTQIRSAPSCLIKAKYCDITGLETRYTDPKTGLNFYSSDVYKIIKTLSPSDVQVYLSLRKAAIVLK